MGKDEKKAISSESLRELAAQKEKEWKQVQELRASSLELTVKELERELKAEKSKFTKLKEDFKYNLKLLTERDSELERYDSVFTELKTSLSQREAELSEVKIRVDDLEVSLGREVKVREDMQAHYQHRVREKQAEVDEYRRVKELSVQQEREDLESVKRNLERQLRELEDEIDIQRRELTQGFDEALRKREHEFRKQADEMSSTVLAHTMKVKLLTKELELARSAQTEASRERDAVSTDSHDLEKQLKQRDWQIQDLTAIKDAQIKELEQKLQSSESSLVRAQEEYSRKHAELDRYAKEKEATISQLKAAASERERHLEGEVRGGQARVEEAEVRCRQLEWARQDAERERDSVTESFVTAVRTLHQARVEEAEVRCRQLEWARQDAEREKDSVTERLQDEITDLKSRWDSRVSELNRDNVSRDMELEGLRETETRLKTELIQRKHDIERYKKELAGGLEREASLERSRAQCELDWQRRCEGVTTQQYEKAEDLVKQLTQARDEAQALLKEKCGELQHASDLIAVMTEDRDRALITLRQHGLIADHNINLNEYEDLPNSAAEQITKLHSQNDNLRKVIHQMRQEMETLGGEVGEGQTARTARSPNTPDTARGAGQGGNYSVAAEYVKNLETEVGELKVKCRGLEQAASDLLGVSSEGPGRVAEVVGDNIIVRTHVEQLNNNMGQLRSEKVELTALSRKQQARIQYLESLMDKLAKEPRDKQVQLEQLQYTMSSGTRRHEAELASSRQRITDLEIQLLETRKEADEYMKASIERNTDITALGQELSAMKMELAEGRPALNFGAQELLIQQLQEEIQQLRNQLKGKVQSIDPMTLASVSGGHTAGGKGQGEPSNTTIAQLQNMLRVAARQISALAREKQQLIEMGNRLRAKLQQNGLRPPSPPPRPIPTMPQQVPTTQPHSQFTSTHTVYPPPPPASQPGVPSGRAPSEVHGRIQSKLSQLETLQYELTKQELAYKQKYSTTKTFVPPISVESSGEFENGDYDQPPRSILKKSVDFDQVDKLSPVPENSVAERRPKTAPVSTHPQRPVTPTRLHPQSARSDPPTHRASSPTHRASSPTKDGAPGSLRVSLSSIGGGESLQEIWNMLDESGTPRTLRDSVEQGPFSGLTFPGDPLTLTDEGRRPQSAGDGGHSSRSWTVKGQKQDFKPKPSLEPKSSRLNPKVGGKVGQAKKPTQKTKIRNYNLKNDSGVG